MISAKKKQFIVEFRPSAIRAARISSATAPAVVEDLLEIDLGSDVDAAGEVRAFANAKGSSYMHAACSVYPEHRALRQIVLDAPRGKEAAFIMDFLKKSLGVDPEAFSAYCLSAQNGSDAELSAFNKKSVFLCGAPKAEITEIQDRLVANGIFPNRLELGSVGTIGILRELMSGSGDPAPVLFLEIDSSSTNAVIIGPKGVEMARRIDCGARHMVAALKEEMNLKDEESAEKILLSRDFDLGPIAPKILRRLLRELQSSIGFFEVQTGNSVSQVYTLKQGRILPWLEGSICDLLNLSPLRLDLPQWLAARDVTFSSNELSKKVDMTWFGMLSLMLEFGREEPAS